MDNQQGITRRDFAAGLAVVSALHGQAGAAAGQPHWYERIRRLGQININEKDGATLDVASWIRYWGEIKVDGLIVSAGGIMAFYPTRVPLHRKCKYLGTRDLFGEFGGAARKANIRVIARLDPTYAFPELFEAHPDWFTRDAAGKPVRHAEARELYSTCMFGPYYDQQMSAIIRELNEGYNPDGYYTNGWPGTGLGAVCYCDRCRAEYRKRFGADLPPPPTGGTRISAAGLTGGSTAFSKSGSCGRGPRSRGVRIASTLATSAAASGLKSTCARSRPPAAG